jgi:transitional endoplasmic reticulum ATPase
VIVDIPSIQWSDIGGLELVKQQLKEVIEWPTMYPSFYEYMGNEPPSGVLLSGPPGTGKTLLVKAVANESSMNFISIKGSQIFSKWIGESERIIEEIFKKARMTSPCIIFFDEIDTIFPKRSTSSNSNSSERLVTTLLTEMDGLEEISGVIVIGATNRPDTIDPAVLRPGRFDHIIKLNLPDKHERKAIFQVHIRNKPIANNIDIEEIINQTDGFSGADIKGVVKLASSYATSRFLTNVNTGSVTNTDGEIKKLAQSKKPRIERGDFDKAIKTLQSSRG